MIIAVKSIFTRECAVHRKAESLANFLALFIVGNAAPILGTGLLPALLLTVFGAVLSEGR